MASATPQKSQSKSNMQFLPSKHWENVSKMFKRIYHDETLADITLCCKDGSIKAHKLILAASSPYFHKIFTENSSQCNRDTFILIMHGVPYQTLRDLIELIYKGNVEVSSESFTRLYELASEFQLTGISSSVDEEAGRSVESVHGRDTRFRGLKRVAVDYNREGTEENSAKRVQHDVSAKFDDRIATIDLDTSFSSSSTASHPSSVPKLTAWAKKQRKFKCNLCPSTFKRSSHLTRHQLVHTGERPFACQMCDKAFSRNDKLRHHIKKAHESGESYDNEVEFSAIEISRVRTPSPLPFVISNVRTETLPEENTSTPMVKSEEGEGMQKRPRGRPRKYPVREKPLVKRGRGRPRLNQTMKSEGSANETINGENYDITNLPYGDLDYLTMPLQGTVIEPLVEIKTEKDEVAKPVVEGMKDKVVTIKDDDEIPAELKEIENKIATIGECTISVANH